MKKTKRLVVPAGKSSCLVSGAVYLLGCTATGLWIWWYPTLFKNLGPRHQFELPTNVVIFFLWIFVGFLCHELCQFFLVHLLGGKPRYLGRVETTYHTYAERLFARRLIPITLRSWAPRKKYFLWQYLFILFIPGGIFLLGLPLLLVLLPHPIIINIGFGIGLGNAMLLSADVVLAGILLFAGEQGLILDSRQGTYICSEG